jgi:hypothetical protein
MGRKNRAAESSIDFANLIEDEDCLGQCRAAAIGVVEGDIGFHQYFQESGGGIGSSQDTELAR